MTAPTNYYVDPVGGNDTTGDGSIGTPWATAQKAFNTITRNSTSGDQVNIKASGTLTISGTWSLATYGTPTDTAPLIIRGYTSAANDGGIGVVSGGGSSIFNSTSIPLVVIDMRFTNCGSNLMIRTGGTSFFRNCQFDNASPTSGVAAVRLSAGVISYCYFTDIAGNGIMSSSGATIANCTFVNGASNKFLSAIVYTGGGADVSFCIFKLDSTSTGIDYRSTGSAMRAVNCSIYSNAGTGSGIYINSASALSSILNNLIVGFSGTGGKAIQSTAGSKLWNYGGNKFYNNLTAFDGNADVFNDAGGNSTLSANPFTDAANGDFSIGTEAKAAGVPSSFKSISTNQYLDPGAAQRQEPAGGGGGRRPRIRAHGV